MQRQLVYFTYSFPFGGLGDSWKLQELEALSEVYDEILVVPFWKVSAQTSHPEHLPAVRILTPLFETHPPLLKNIFTILGSRRVLTYLKEAWDKRVFRNRKWLASWMLSCILTERTLAHPALSTNLYAPETVTTLYFFWGVGAASIIPFLDRSRFEKIIVRFHGYDLYEDDPAYDGYLPFRKQIMANITEALFVSKHGLNYASRAFPETRQIRRVAILGARPRGASLPSTDGVLRLLTIASLIPLKRMHLLAEALLQLPFPVEWTHVGDGPERPRIEAILAKRPGNIALNFVGQVAPDQVAGFYAGQTVDLFLNLSDTEGMPVSIMEAMSAGIPVLATDVGGNAEIVSEANGRVLPADLNPDMLADALRWFQALDAASRAKLREASQTIFNRELNATTNARRLAETLSGTA